MWAGEQITKYEHCLRDKSWEDLSKVARKELYDNDPQVREAVRGIANFFEHLGSGAKHKGLDLRFVLPVFGGVTQIYWNQLHEVLEKAFPHRRFMEHFKWLNEECEKREPLQET